MLEKLRFLSSGKIIVVDVAEDKLQIAKELGLRGSYSGIGARLFMVGTLTAGQFAIYGDIKKVRLEP